MKRVILLSEIHPLGTDRFNPIQQASRWHSLLTPEDLTLRLSFIDAIALIDRRCEERDAVLLIRDWSHLDFTAVPFLQQPSYRLTTAEMLSDRFEIIHTATVRHPIDQWLSLRDLVVMQNVIDLNTFLRGYRRFAETSARIGFIRYEDYTTNPDQVMAVLCQRLDVPFDPEFIHHWAEYSLVTGDLQRARSDSEIASQPRRPMEDGLLSAFETNQDYQEAISILGYDTR